MYPVTDSDQGSQEESTAGASEAILVKKKTKKLTMLPKAAAELVRSKRTPVDKPARRNVD